jgi:hypothetical protein
MRVFNPQIDLQRTLGQQIMNVIQGFTIENIRHQCEGNIRAMNFRGIKEGTSFKVSEKLLPQFHALCEEVKEKLDFEDPIDFYITGDSEINACAAFSYDENHPHMIEINSGAYNLLNEDELKYLVGHEIGHLIDGDAVITGVFCFLYPDDEALDKCPEYLIKRYDLYKQVAELSADRYGYKACENLDTCVRAIFKMASGVDLEKMNVSVKALMEENDRHLECLFKEGGFTGDSHPVDPIRVRALDLFANAKTQTALTKGMIELVNAMQTFTFGELDDALADFVASAGILLSQVDGKCDKNEEEYIIKELAQFTLFPYKILKQVEKGDVVKIFEESFNKILELATPEDDVTPLNYILEIVIADRYLDDKEISVVYELGRRMGLSDFQISKEIAEKLREKFQPRATALK